MLGTGIARGKEGGQADRTNLDLGSRNRDPVNVYRG